MSKPFVVKKVRTLVKRSRGVRGAAPAFMVVLPLAFDRIGDEGGKKKKNKLSIEETTKA